MKKLFTLVLLSLCFLSLRAQHMVTVYGKLTASNGASVENINVHIQYGDTLNGGLFHNKNVLTDVTGFYADTLSVPSNNDSSWVYVDITDCNGNTIWNAGGISHSTTPSVEVNFEYCKDTVVVPDSSFNWVYVNGKLSANATSVSNIPVQIGATNGYYNAVWTDSQGYYWDSIPVIAGVTSGTVEVTITDCMGNYRYNSNYFSANNRYLNMDFVYCNDSVTNPGYGYIYLSGQLTSIVSSSVANKEVYINGVMSNGTSIRNGYRYTDSFGMYRDTIPVSLSASGTFTVQITDCMGGTVLDYVSFSPSNRNLTLDLNYCSDTIVTPDSSFKWVYVNGILTSNVGSVSNVPVHIGSTMNANYETVWTDNQGYYWASIPVSIGTTSGSVSATITDCTGQSQFYSKYYNGSNTVTIDFVYCNDSIPPSTKWGYLSGHITAGNDPVAGVPVNIKAYSWSYQKQVLTDNQGAYYDSIPLPQGTHGGSIFATIVNCYGDSVSCSRSFFAGSNHMIADFNYCQDTTVITDSSWISIGGQLTSVNSSVDNKLVRITGNNASHSFTYYSNKYTSANGYYSDSLKLPVGVTNGTFTVVITDCNGTSAAGTMIFSPTNHRLKIDLNYCSDTISAPDSSFKWVYITGKLSSNAAPVSNIPVLIHATLNNYQNDVWTDVQGYYWDSIPVMAGASGTVIASITNCLGQNKSESRYFHANSGFITMNFEYCADSTITPDSLKYYSIQGYIGAPDTMYSPNKNFRVYLIRTFATNDTLPVVVDSLDTPVYYWFDNPGAGNYIVRAVPMPGSVAYGKFFPTYYGQTLGWADAAVISRPTTNMELNNIWMLQADSTQGIGTISGSVVDEFENGMEGVQLILSDDNDVILNCATTDAQGMYAFNNIPLKSYKIWGEILGKQHEIEHVEITSAAPVSEHNDFKVVGDSILAVQRGTGIASNNANNTNVSVSPNPASERAALTVSVSQSTKATVTVYSVTGSKVWQQIVALQSGKQQIELPLYMLEKGVYIIETMTNDAKMMSRLVKE